MEQLFDATTFWGALQQSRAFVSSVIKLGEAPDLHFRYAMEPSFLALIGSMDYEMWRDHPSNQYDEYQKNEWILTNSIFEEAIASSQIEGAVITRSDAKVILRQDRKPQGVAEQMVVNNYRTIQFLKQQKSAPLTEALLCDIQRMITDQNQEPGIEGGQIRINDRVTVQDALDGEVMHRPPAAADLPQIMQQFYAFCNDELPHPYIHPIIKAIIIHYMVGYFHPFQDGNGRTARALFYWYLVRQGYWFIEYLSISRYILEAKSQYYRAYLYAVQNGNGVNYFIWYNLNVLSKAYQGLNTYLQKQKTKKLAQFEALKTHQNLNERQAGLIASWQRKPKDLVSIENHQRYHRVTYQTARTDLLKLVDMGLARMIKAGKKQLFERI